MKEVFLVQVFHHFFLCSSIDTPPGPSDTIIRRPPITESVYKQGRKQTNIEVEPLHLKAKLAIQCEMSVTWKKSYFKKSLRGLWTGMVHHALW